MKTKGLFFKDFKSSYFPEILKEVYRERIYEPYLGGRKDLTIVDCGGNIGLTTFYFYDYAKKLYTIEPSKQHTEVIKTMLDYNEMNDKVILIEKALANTNGKATFYHNSNATMFSLKQAVNDNSSQAEEVETITLDKLFFENDIKHVDFMKLDVEGAEAEIIGGQGFENAIKLVDSLVFEYHTWNNTNPALLVNALKDYGFEVKQIPSDALLFGARRIK